MTNREKVIEGLKHCEFGVSGSCYEKDCPYYQSHDCTDELKNDILALLNEHESVVRCKDCKYWRQNTGFCEQLSVGNVAQHTPPNCYCAAGERP